MNEDRFFKLVEEGKIGKSNEDQMHAVAKEGEKDVQTVLRKQVNYNMK